MLKCRVARTFINHKDKWSLTTQNATTGERLTVRGTAEHPFYVQNKGWTPLGELREGDELLPASGETMVVAAKEHHPEIVEVYNVEVEEAHTYFVGESTVRSLWVHNSCLGDFFKSYGRYFYQNYVETPKQAIVYVHNNVGKPAARKMWKSTAMPAALDPKGLAAQCMDHCLQDNPGDLYFPKSHSVANTIRNSVEYIDLKNQIVAKAKLGESFNFSETIRFTNGDLFLAIHEAKVTFEGKFDAMGNITELTATLTDKFDFALETGYAKKNYGYGYLKYGYYGYGYGNSGYGYNDYGCGYGYGNNGYNYGRGYKSGAFGVAALVANNMAWADQKLGVIVPFSITIEIE